MPSLEERIKEIEEEIRKTPKNKGTEAHLAKLKAKLAALKEISLKSSKKGVSTQGIKKQGHATVCMVGFPSVGKSSLLNTLSNAESKIGEYAFTTTEAVPGMMFYNGAYIQLLDLPGIIEQASQGIGMGKEILSYARVADLLLLVVDPTKDVEKQLSTIKKELHHAGFRLRKKKPDITIIKKDRGGIDVFIPSHLGISKQEVVDVARDFNIHNAEIIVRDVQDIEDIYDAFFGNRVYVDYLVVLTKKDLIGNEELKELSKKLDGEKVVAISTKTGEGIDELKHAIFNALNLIRIYTKKPSQKLDEVDREEPLILRSGSTIKDVASKLGFNHKEVLFARVWGKSARFPGQRVGLDHRVEDEDVVEISLKK